MKKDNSNYRWVIAVSGFIIMAVGFSIINTIHTLFVNPVTKSLGFSISSFSLLFTISAIVLAIVSPIIGNLVSKVNIKIIMTISSILAGGGFICYAFASNIYVFYLIAIFVSIGVCGLTTIPISTMISDWFEDSKKGSMMGLVFAGIGTGTFFWMQIVSRILQKYDYRLAYILLGSIVLIVTLPICIFVVKRNVQYEDKVQGKNSDTKVIKKATNFKEISQTSGFWIFAIGLLLMGISFSGIQLHVQSYLVYLKYPLSFNANIGSLLAISALGGNILGGIIFDKFPTKKVMVSLGSLSLFSIVCLILSGNRYFTYMFAIFFGLCMAMPSLWPSYGVSRLFSNENYSVILGVVNMFFTIGAAIGPFLSGIIADSIWGYKLAWVIYFVLTIIYYLMFIRTVTISSEKKS